MNITYTTPCGSPVKSKLVKLSICPFGHHLLQDEIELGTEYVVFPATVKPNAEFTLLCGGCHRMVPGVGSILALSALNPTASPRPLPLEIFDISYEYVPEVKANV